MRISEWSSDVCLPVNTPTIETRLTAKLDTLSEHDRRIAATVTINDVTMKPEASDVVAIWNRNPEAKRCAAREWHLGKSQSVAEIGRASCRERVCQYV